VRGAHPSLGRDRVGGTPGIPIGDGEVAAGEQRVGMLQGEQLRDDHLERDVPIQAQIRGPIDERRPPRSMSDSIR
jgi:hypothetical protein